MRYDRQNFVRYTHCFSSVLRVSHHSFAGVVQDFFAYHVRQDLGVRGDSTTSLFSQGKNEIVAQVLAKDVGVVAGLEELRYFLDYGYKSFFSGFHVQFLKKDGDVFGKGEKILLLRGKAEDIFVLERTMLNFLQRMSGVATAMRDLVQLVPSSVLVTSTRKTFWGLLDKKACVVGGGGTHRLDLSDAVLVKDTHLDLLGGDFQELFRRLRLLSKRKVRFIEIEVGTLSHALEIARLIVREQHAGFLRSVPWYIMLDNMSPSQVIQVVRCLKEEHLYDEILLEASGGITEKNIRKYAQTGVDILSVGSVTHSARALDMSLKLQ